MANANNLGFYCVLLFVLVQGYYAWDLSDGGRPRLKIFHHICALKKDEGPCKALLDRFYFDIETGSCESFEYGGCEGNDNNFETLKECQEKCIMDEKKNPCSLPEETGPCRGLVPRYFFDRRSQRCERFYYGGCYGNANNFRTMNECQAKCQQKVSQTDTDGSKPSKHTKEIPVLANVVTEPTVVVAHTQARILEALDGIAEAPVSGVNVEAEKMEPVDVVTAAPLNVTRFLQQTQEAEDLNIPHFCLSPIDRGNCDGVERRYTYNPKKGRCQLFRYSGCGGNKNNFVHKRHCMKMCMKGHSNLRLIRIKKKNSYILNPAA